MKRAKILIAIAAILIPIFCATNITYAAKDACDIAEMRDPLICPPHPESRDEEAELMHLIRNILTTVYVWVGIIAVICIIIGGIIYMTSRGDPGKITQAKNTILYSIIGLVITLLAFAITNFAISALNGHQ